MVATSPDTWQPFKQCDELVPVTNDIWRIADACSFGSAGELVTFTIEDGGVKQVRFGGMSAWPEPEWADIEKRLVPERTTTGRAKAAPE